MGASLGFLFWNYNPAKIFMGDGGAMLLGFVPAAVGAKLRFFEPSSQVSWLIPPLILGVAILDTTLVVVSRLRRGLMPFSSPGEDHVAHRLAWKVGERKAVALLWGVGILCGVAALLVSYLPALIGYALVATMAVAAVVAIIRLERRLSDHG